MARVTSNWTKQNEVRFRMNGVCLTREYSLEMSCHENILKIKVNVNSLSVESLIECGNKRRRRDRVRVITSTFDEVRPACVWILTLPLSPV
jgi:hypothetical protein